jgi:twinkle protein
MSEKIDWSSLDFKGKTTGEISLLCPLCSHTRKKKNLKCLGVNLDKGVGACNHCGAKTNNNQNTMEKTYTLPKQDWQNFTKLSEQLVKWLWKERCIGQNTLVKMGVSEEIYYQPQLQKKVNNIVFNYFEGGEVVNKKYRTGNKQFTQSKGGKSIFYNINSVKDAEVVYIVEGEFDVLALYEIGIKTAISVPNGANDNDDYWKNSEKYLKDVERFVIAVDNDEKGNELKEKIAHRLGMWRCEFVEFENKDANGDLIAGILKESIKNTKRFPITGTVLIEDLKDGILDYYRNGLPETLKPKHNSFERINKFFSLMKGHLCTITGIPSHGKSEFTEWYVMNLVNDYSLKASFFTPEHAPLSLHQTRFIPKVVGKPFWKGQGNRITEQDINRYTKWANEKIYYTMPEAGEVATWDWMLNKFKEQMFNFGINIFVIDAFNKVQGAPSKEEKDSVLTKLSMFAQVNNVVIMLVAHPTKMRKEEDGTYNMPTLYDISGTSDFRNQTHDGYVIHRNFTDNTVTFCNLKTKYNFQGKIGESALMGYDIPTGRYYDAVGQIPTFDMTMPKAATQTVIKPNKEFELIPDEIEDCPF